jgi:hypothetical protein
MDVITIFIFLFQLVFFHIKYTKIPGDTINNKGKMAISNAIKKGDISTIRIINHVSLYTGFFNFFIKWRNKRILLVQINSIKSH